MKAEEFNKLTTKEQLEEMDKCKSFEYFYNNYCKKEGMPEFSQKAWDEYVKNSEKQRFGRRKINDNCFYPLTPEECFKN